MCSSPLHVLLWHEASPSKYLHVDTVTYLLRTSNIATSVHVFVLAMEAPYALEGIVQRLLYVLSVIYHCTGLYSLAHLSPLQNWQCSHCVTMVIDV